MNDNRQRFIGHNEQTLVEQVLLNMVLRGDIAIHRKGRDITQSLIDQADRINADYDKKYPTSSTPTGSGRISQASPASMPVKKTEPPAVRPPRQRRVAKAAAGAPKKA